MTSNSLYILGSGRVAFSSTGIAICICAIILYCLFGSILCAILVYCVVLCSDRSFLFLAAIRRYVLPGDAAGKSCTPVYPYT